MVDNIRNLLIHNSALNGVKYNLDEVKLKTMHASSLSYDSEGPCRGVCRFSALSQGHSILLVCLFLCSAP